MYSHAAMQCKWNEATALRYKCIQNFFKSQDKKISLNKWQLQTVLSPREGFRQVDISPALKLRRSRTTGITN